MCTSPRTTQQRKLAERSAQAQDAVRARRLLEDTARGTEVAAASKIQGAWRRLRTVRRIRRTVRMLQKQVLHEAHRCVGLGVLRLTAQPHPRLYSATSTRAPSMAGCPHSAHNWSACGIWREQRALYGSRPETSRCSRAPTGCQDDQLPAVRNTVQPSLGVPCHSHCYRVRYCTSSAKSKLKDVAAIFKTTGSSVHEWEAARAAVEGVSDDDEAEPMTVEEANATLAMSQLNSVSSRLARKAQRRGRR